MSALRREGEIIRSLVLGLAVLAFTFGSSVSGAAQTSAPTTVVPGVTVTPAKPIVIPSGPPVIPTPQQRDFVRSHAAASRIGQMTRWGEPICPTTVGLSPEMNDFVSERIKTVAAQVGAPAGRCKSDVVVVFTRNPQALLDHVRKKAPVLLGFHYPAQAKRLATVTHPIQAWYVTATSGAPGAGGMGGLGASQLSGPLGAAAQGGSGEALDDSDAAMPGGCAGTHFSECLTNHIVAVVVVADRDQVADHTIGSISDYIAMLVLSKVDLSQDCGDLDSITNLMSAKCGAAGPKPEALTEADLAYLKALYSINMARYMWVQRDSVADIMAKVMAGGREK
jgi:outer membrane lipoprotein SlyB